MLSLCTNIKIDIFSILCLLGNEKRLFLSTQPAQLAFPLEFIARRLGARPPPPKKKWRQGEGGEKFPSLPSPFFYLFIFIFALVPPFAHYLERNRLARRLLSTELTRYWLPLVSLACEYSRPPCSSLQGRRLYQRGQTAVFAGQATTGRQRSCHFERKSPTHSLPPPRHPSPPHQLNTTVALVNNAVQNVSVIKILTCNHPSEDWVVTFLINCLYVSCPP